MKAQRIQLAQALIRLAPDVTPKDRKECAKKLKISKVTVCYYLAGKVGKSDVGIEMLEFFKSRIESRQQEIKTLCQNQ